MGRMEGNMASGTTVQYVKQMDITGNEVHMSFIFFLPHPTRKYQASAVFRSHSNTVLSIWITAVMNYLAWINMILILSFIRCSFPSTRASSKISKILLSANFKETIAI